MGLLAAAAPVAALAAPGELDASYGTGGVFTAPFQIAAPAVREQYAVVDSQGRTVIAATHVDVQGQKHLDVMRLTAQGTLDATFNPGGATPGIVEVDFSATVGALDVQARGVAVTAGDKVVALGWVNGNGNHFTGLVRLGSDGSYDATFGPNHDGRVVDEQNPNYATFPDSLAVDWSGRILVGGSCGSGCGGFVSRYTDTGARDTGAFNASDASHPGVLVVQTTDIASLATLSDGSVLVAGESALDANDALIARVRADGTLDPHFNAGGSTPGVVESPMGSGPGGDAFAYGVAAGPGGSVYVTGQVVDNSSSMRILRLTSAGLPDAGFGNGSPATGVVTVPVASARGLSIAVDGSSCPMAVGLATVQTNNQILAARLTPNGQLDAAFNPAGPTPGTALFQLPDSANGETIALQDDGNIVIGGYSQQGSPPDRRAIALRLQGDGCGGGGGGAPAPTVVTGQASNVTNGAATLNGTVNPNGAQLTNCHFDYGTTTNYGSSVACSQLPAAGSSPVAVSAPISGLAPNTPYDYRLVTSSPGGTSTGGNQTFTTPPILMGTMASTTQGWQSIEGSSITVPAGATGEFDKADISNANGSRASGTVTFKLYSQRRLDGACIGLMFSSTNPVSTSRFPLPVADNFAISDPVTYQLSPGHTYYWTASYSGDSENQPSTSACGSETLTVQPSVSTFQQWESITGSSITVPAGATGEDDTADISNANLSGASGTVTFDLYSDSGCTSVVFSSTNRVSTRPLAGSAVDNFVRSNPVTYQLSPGRTYYWTASYSGDSENQPSTSACGSETLTVQPAVVTGQEWGSEAGASIVVPAGATGERDVATISNANGSRVSGTVTFNLYSGSGCTRVVFTSTKPVSTGRLALPVADNVATSDPVTQQLLPGTYYWTASYSGDSQNQPSTSPCGSETLTVGFVPRIGPRAFSSPTAITLAIGCPVACRLRITITAPALLLSPDARNRGKPKPAVILLARATVTIRKHSAQKITLRLTSAGRRFITSHHGRVTVTATIAMTVNGHTTTLERRLTLKITKPGKPAHLRADRLTQLDPDQKEFS